MNRSLQETHSILQRELLPRVSGELYMDSLHRGMYATDASHYQIMPAAVLMPRDNTDVAAALAVAKVHHIAITARGAGTSLSGQTHGPGIVVDCSRYLHGILSLDPVAKTARVQPGVILDQLNTEAAEHGLHFAPDPATTSRCTIGGMVGNNSSGTRSIRYGKTSDHVLSVLVGLPGGELIELGPDTPQDHRLISGVRKLVEEHRSEIETRFPKVMRRVSGYALDAFLQEGPINLARLLCGSEGTLGVLLEVTVKLEPIPAHRSVCVVQFDNLFESLRRISSILEYNPTALELLDGIVIAEAKVNPSTRELATFIDGTPDAMLIVEFSGEDAADQAHRCADGLKQQGIGTAWPVMTDPAEQARAWDVRRLGLGLITNRPGPVKGQAFVEDACLPIEHLATYTEQLYTICADEGVPITTYAHASVGVLHMRPMLDLHSPDEILKMKRIADRAFDLVCEYGGAWAGEHGDGIVRGEYIKRYFGERLYNAFREVKQLFDPSGILNPNKLIDPPPMTDHLRYQTEGYQSDFQSHFTHKKQGGLLAAVEQCNGVGACRKLGKGVMCPSYMATREERDCTRGRANALRLALTGQLAGGVGSQELQDVMSLCLGCKACKSECPNAVDVAKFKSEVQQAAYDQTGTPLGVKIVGSMPILAHHFAGRFSPLINGLQGLRPNRWLLEKMSGIDRTRPLPRFARRSLAKMNLGCTAAEADVILFNDSYTNAWEPEVGVAALKVLASHDLRVHVASVGDSQRARISKGLLRLAKRDGARLLKRLATFGKPVVVLEPSCYSAIVDDLPDLMDAPPQIDAWLLDDFLVDRGLICTAPEQPILIHGHCHQKALSGLTSLQTLLPEATIIEAGCCGMAGSFGYEHPELSKRIGEDRLFPAVRNAPEDALIVANGFSCRHQIAEHCGGRPLHLAEVLALGIK